MVEFFGLNAAPMGGESVAEYITYDTFVDLLLNFVSTSADFNIIDTQPPPPAPEGPSQNIDDEQFR